MIASEPPALIEVEGLAADYRRDGGWFGVIEDLGLTIRTGEALGLAGESGCGKSTLAALLMGEARRDRRIRAGAIRFEGRDVSAMGRRELRRLRAARLAFVPQNAATALTPTMRIGRLFAETLRTSRRPLAGTAAAERARRSLALVGLPDPDGALRRYPHQFSGGQQQRISLALALCRDPDLLILDEPTTGQDAVTRLAIVTLLAELRAAARTAMLYVSHDLATLSEVCDRIAIMYAGQIVEAGPADEVLLRPRHPYAQALIASVPRPDVAPDPSAMLAGTPVRQHRTEGCRFAPRCRYAEPECLRLAQRLRPVGPGHAVACHRSAAIAAVQQGDAAPVRQQLASA
ncbi:MAG: ABC transporter ATP-binding protein [Dongiaceae bacterium]